MNQNTAKQEAERIKEMFRDTVDNFPVQCMMYCNGGDIERGPLSKKLSEIHVQGIIDELDNMQTSDFFWDLLNERKQFYTQVLHHLQTKI